MGAGPLQPSLGEKRGVVSPIRQGVGSYPLPENMAVLFGERPDMGFSELTVAGML